MMRALSPVLLVIAALTLSAPSYAKTAQLGPEPSPDGLLNKAFDDIARQRFDAALGNIESLIRVRPNFRLAHLIKGDLLLARVRPLSKLGDAPNGPVDRIVDLREEAFARLRAYRERPNGDVLPRYLLQLNEEQKFAVVVDTRRSRLFLYRNDGGKPSFAGDYYVSSGRNGAFKLREGDQKTPIGVYRVTSSLPRSKLSEFYGHGAFPISYPNEWDRRQGRNGHGIWLHGTPPDTYSRPPRASDGCVVLSNSDLDALAEHLQIGLTPVIISEQVEWVSPGALDAERGAILHAIEQWRNDWESRDTNRYLAHYAAGFSANGQDRAAWGRHKKQVNAAKNWIKIGLSNLSVFRSPGKDEIVVVTFTQDYRSNNLSNAMKKRQYWLRDGQRWRIVYEGAA